MNHVCQKCFVGFHYIMLIKRKKFICLKCSNKVSNKTILKYEKRRVGLWEKLSKYETENIYNS